MFELLPAASGMAGVDPMVFYSTVLDRITEVFSGLLLP